MAAPSFSDVARAYSPDFSGIADEFFRGRQLAQQQAIMQQNRQDKAVSDRDNYLSSAAQIKPSMTPHDFYLNPQLGKLNEEIAADIKANPFMGESQVRRKYGQRIADLQHGSAMATSLDKQIQERIGAASKDNTVFDGDPYRQDLIRSAFYDEKGEPLPSPNINAFFDPRFDLADPDNMAKYSNPELARNEFAKRFKESTKAQPVTIQDVLDPSSGLKVPYNTYATPYESIAADGMSRERNNSVVSVGDKTYNLLPEEQAAQFNDENITRTMLLNGRKKYEGDESFQSLPKDVQRRVVLNDLIDPLLSGIEYKKGAFDYSGARMAETKKQNALRNARADAQLRLAQQREARAAKKQAVVKKVGENKLIDIFDYMNDDNNDGAELAELDAAPSMAALSAVANAEGISPIAKKYITSGQPLMNPAKNNKYFSVKDVSRGTKTGFLSDKETGGFIKPLVVTDKISGKKILIEQMVTKQKVNKDGTITPMEIYDTRVIPQKDVKGRLKSYQSDFGLKEKELDDYFDDADAADEEESQPTATDE